MLAVGLFGHGSCLGDRIEMVVRRGRGCSARMSAGRLAGCAIVLCGLTLCGALVPHWIAFAQGRTAFDVTAVKPNDSGSEQVELARPVGTRFAATNVSLRMLIMRACKVKDFELSGGPAWVESSRFDISATTTGPAIGEPEFKEMLQSLLADRFRLRVHRETKEMPVYVLAPAKDGLKLPAANGSCVARGALTPGTPGVVCGGFIMNDGLLEGRKISMAQFATALSNFLGRPVIDKTGYNDAFDLHLEFTFQGIAQVGGGGFGAPTLPAAADTDEKPTIFTALEKQLGLKLESGRGSDKVLAIDHAEKPDAN